MHAQMWNGFWVETKSWTPAHCAAQEGRENCLRTLHEAGANLSAKTVDGKTPAHLAASNGHDACMRALHGLGAGASFFVADKDGDTPAHYAAFHGHNAC